MAKSLQSQVNELKRTVEKHHLQHKLLKSKVTELERRIRVLEPYLYAKDRYDFLILMEELCKLVGKEGLTTLEEHESKSFGHNKQERS